MSSTADFPTDLQKLEHDYELIREIGQGGMAAVYLGRHRTSGRFVAIKAIRARYLDDAEALHRFAREARTVADLDHPNIVRTEAIEQIDDRAVAIIMEHVSGGTVRDHLREYGPFSAERAESVLRDVASALAYAHRRGIVHRDVKPENVFLDTRTGRALLSDFGIARRIEGDIPITMIGAALGTPQYMSPEQIDGRVVDGRSDIYSLGVLGWELLTGRRPWAGDSLYEVIYKQKHENLPPITELRPRVPANLLIAIERALMKERERRWQSADEFLEHLAYEPPPVLSQRFTPSRIPPTDEPTLRFPRPAEVVAAGSRPMSSHSSTPNDALPPRAPASLRGPSWRRRVPRLDVPRGLRALALVVPLAIALASIYVVLGGRGLRQSRGQDAPRVTTSGGSVALDTASSKATPSTRRDTAASVPARGGSSTTAPPSAALPRARNTTEPRPSDTTPATLGIERRTTAAARPRPPVAKRDSISAPRGRGPSPRCSRPTMADQRACLLAHIAVNDAQLQRVYDGLIAELRRVAGVKRGASDPSSVRRLRVEQRAWVAVRDRECTRNPALRSAPLWAEELSKCFAEMSAARADELGEALARVRRQ